MKDFKALIENNTFFWSARKNQTESVVKTC